MNTSTTTLSSMDYSWSPVGINGELLKGNRLRVGALCADYFIKKHCTLDIAPCVSEPYFPYSVKKGREWEYVDVFYTPQQLSELAEIYDINSIISTK